MTPCPVSYHVNDCDCHRKSDGKWSIDPACAAKHKRLRADSERRTQWQR